MDGDGEPEATLFPATVGEKLRGARESQGIELADIASRTRIPQRHLEAIERSNYASLPSITYALGFAKAYARAVGVDEVGIAKELRRELDAPGQERISTPVPSYDYDDQPRTAPGGLVWISLAVALLVLIGAGVMYGTGWFRGTAPAPETLVIPEESPTPDNATMPIAETGGQVTLIALDTVWIRINDGNGNRIVEKELAPGERYDVPRDADRPRIRTVRPDRIQVTINGSNVPPLGQGAQAVEVDVSADALRARGTGPAPGTSPAPASTPVARSTPTRTQRPATRPTARDPAVSPPPAVDPEATGLPPTP